MRTWLKAAAIAALVSWLLMGGLDFLESHYYVWKGVQQDVVSMHVGFLKTLSGGK